MTGASASLLLDALVVLVVSGATLFLRGYLAEKAKNAASREDLDELTRVVESVRSGFRLQEEAFRRGSRVHEMQVRALTRLYADLSEAHAYFQEMTKSVRYEGEDPRENEKRFLDAAERAVIGYRETRLLLPVELADKCEAFFPKINEGLHHRYMAQSGLIPSGPERADAWRKAVETAYRDLPALLRSIEGAARVVIHGS